MPVCEFFDVVLRGLLVRLAPGTPFTARLAPAPVRDLAAAPVRVPVAPLRVPLPFFAPPFFVDVLALFFSAAAASPSPSLDASGSLAASSFGLMYPCSRSVRSQQRSSSRRAYRWCASAVGVSCASTHGARQRRQRTPVLQRAQHLRLALGVVPARLVVEVGQLRIGTWGTASQATAATAVESHSSRIDSTTPGTPRYQPRTILQQKPHNLGVVVEACYRNRRPALHDPDCIIIRYARVRVYVVVVGEVGRGRGLLPQRWGCRDLPCCHGR